MSRSAANAENIALNLKYAAEALADAQQYLDKAVTLADEEGQGHGVAFAAYRGAVATVKAPIRIAQKEWDGFTDARQRRDEQNLAKLRRNLTGATEPEQIAGHVS